MGPRTRHNSKQPTRTIGYSVWFGILIGAFVGFLIVAGMYMIVQQKYTYIDAIIISGNKVVGSEAITGVVQDVLNDPCFIHVTCQYGLWLSEVDVAHAITAEYPRIKDAQVKYDHGRLMVLVSERNIAFRYCTDESLQYCYFADDDSILFERAPNMSDLRMIPTVIPDNKKIRVDIVGRILPTRLWNIRDLNSYQKMAELVGRHGRIYVVRFSQRDMNVEVDKLYGYSLIADTAILKFNRASLVDVAQVPYLEASIERMESFQPFISRFTVYPGSLEYIDFRFPKRMYMKFSNSNTEVSF